MKTWYRIDKDTLKREAVTPEHVYMVAYGSFYYPDIAVSVAKFRDLDLPFATYEWREE